LIKFSYFLFNFCAISLKGSEKKGIKHYIQKEKRAKIQIWTAFFLQGFSAA